MAFRPEGPPTRQAEAGPVQRDAAQSEIQPDEEHLMVDDGLTPKSRSARRTTPREVGARAA